MFASKSLLLGLVLLVATFVHALAGDENNCDPGTDVARNDVDLTDVAFNVSEVRFSEGENFNESTLVMEQLYFPEQVIPFDYRSSVFMYVTYVNGTGFTTEGCGFEWDFGSGSNGGHGSNFSVPANCLTITENPGADTYPVTYEGNLEYYYCIGNTTSCDRVDGDIIGYDSTSRFSLDPEHYCTKLVYDIKLTVTSGELDDLVTFVLEYIRDPIDTSEIDQFFDAEGNARTLDDTVIWAICDYNEDGDASYEECYDRMAVNPEPRVLSMSTPTQENPFAMTFGLGPSDRDLVDDTHPLTIDADDSKVYLFHADYTGDYTDCASSSLCTDASTTTNMNLLEYIDALPFETLQNWHIAFNANMPVFDSTTTQKCDISYCTIVLVLNFESKQTGRRLSFRHAMPFKMGHRELLEEEKIVGHRLLESATQTKATKTTAAPQPIIIITPPEVEIDEPETIIDTTTTSFGILFIVLILLAGLVSACCCCFAGAYLLRKNNNQDDVHKDHSSTQQLPSFNNDAAKPQPHLHEVLAKF